MSDAVLTNEQSIKLLRELATNKGFRERFEEKPAAALVEIGIPHETVINLKAACLAPMKLADSKVFQRALEEHVHNAAQLCLSMVTPQLRLEGAGPSTST
jgi:putative modified peptide